MASKIFSGNIPELINEIILHCQNDFSTLQSCILVNRLWCRLAIPLLWEDPFSVPTENYHFIEIYLRNLTEDDKTKLKDYGIHNNLIPSNTLFNYPRFIKCLNIYKIGYSIEKWVNAAFATKKPYFTTSNIARLIFKSLFKIFIDDKVKFHTLGIFIGADIYLDDTFELFLQNPNLIHNVKNLRLKNFKLVNDKIINKVDTLMTFISSNCNAISTLHFEYVDELSTRKFSQIINSQQNLQKILFDYGSSYGSSLLLSSLKNSHCSNTLKTIIFYRVDFKNVVILNEVFEQLNVLESVHILYCLSLNPDFIQQIINMTNPFKLKSLFMDKKSQIESFQLLLQKSGDYLENIGFGLRINNQLKQQLFELIIKYCKNIKFLDLLGYNNQNIPLVFDLIQNISQNLNYLSINFCKFHDFDHIQLVDDIELSSAVLLNLGQTLPSKLEYLSLSLMINTKDFEIFLKNSKNTFIKKLLIRNKIREASEDILPYVKEYIMKKKRVKYLAIKEVSFDKCRNLVSFVEKVGKVDEVEEFNLYDIKVRNYDDLNIDCYNFIKEMY